MLPKIVDSATALLLKHRRTVKKIMPSKVLQLSKILLNKYKQRNFKPYIIKKRVEGEAFDFLIGDADGKDWYDHFNTDTEHSEMRIIKDKIIKAGDIVMECGGHHGFTAILLSKWVGNKGKVITFEPNPKNVEILNRNIEINKLNNIDVKQKAVGSKNGRIIIAPFSNAMVVSNSNFNGIDVEMVKLDSYIDLNPTFIKIDVEGYEVEVLKGAENILKRSPKLAIEIHAEKLYEYGTSVEELISLLGLNRYNCWVQWNDREKPIKFDGNKRISKRVHLFAISK
jgi:FkbM family methyltransferase